MGFQPQKPESADLICRLVGLIVVFYDASLVSLLSWVRTSKKHRNFK